MRFPIKEVGVSGKRVTFATVIVVVCVGNLLLRCVFRRLVLDNVRREDVSTLAAGCSKLRVRGISGVSYCWLSAAPGASSSAPARGSKANQNDAGKKGCHGKLVKKKAKRLENNDVQISRKRKVDAHSKGTVKKHDGRQDAKTHRKAVGKDTKREAASQTKDKAHGGFKQKKGNRNLG